MSSKLAATVLVPTTGDRGPLLPYSVGSILGQSVRDIEVFIMGDGVTDATRTVIADIVRRDSRVRFFDHPKHERRGEPFRHAALAEARGTIVCYLCDRDLMLPNHIEVMCRLLSEADFGHTLRVGLEPDGGFAFDYTLDINDPRDRLTALHSASISPLAFTGHTLRIYRRLPFGWRTTPAGFPTDTYMWQQFLALPECRTATGTHPTIVYLRRGAHPGWPVGQRLAEMASWQANLGNPDCVTAFAEGARDAAIRALARLARERDLGQSLYKALGRRLPGVAASLRRFPRLLKLMKRGLR